jgi:hypothetical protein
MRKRWLVSGAVCLLMTGIIVARAARPTPASTKCTNESCQVGKTMRSDLFAVLLASAMPLAAGAGQSTTLKRSGVSATIRRRFPGPRQIPSSWTRADATLGQSPRCALVVAAVRAIETSARTDPDLRRVSISRASCIRVWRTTLRNPHSNRIVSDNWSVELLSDGQADVSVTLDPRTGAGHAGLRPREFSNATEELCRLPA